MVKGYSGPRKHNVSLPGVGNLADFMSYLTSHAYGAGGITRAESISDKAQTKAQGFPSLEEKAFPQQQAGKSLTPAGIASTLSFKGVSSGGQASKAGVVSAAMSGSKATTAKAIKDYALDLSSSEISSIVEMAENVWRALAEKRIPSPALQEYLRAIRVEWKNNSLSLKLEGWEAASRELGWAPAAGGMEAGLGRYDGTPRDLKPIILGGKSKKIIPLKLEGTQSSFESMLSRSSLGGEGSPTNSMISDDVKDALSLKPGEKVRQSRTSPGRTSPYKSERGKGGFGRRASPSDDRYTATKYTRSILSGAVKAVSRLKPALAAYGGTDLDSDGTFISFRTMVADGYAQSKAPGKRLFKIGFSRARLAKMKNDKSKWWTAGRAPYQLMEAVLDSMRNVITNKLMAKRVSSLQEQFFDLAKSSMKSRIDSSLAEFLEEGELDELTGVVSKVFQNAMNYLAQNVPPRSSSKRRR